MSRAPTIDVLRGTIFDDDPAGILAAFLRMRTMQQVGFSMDELEKGFRTWEMASLALIGDPRLARAAMDERERFRTFILEIKRGEGETKQPGIMILNPNDWPPKHLIDRAIVALQYAQMSSMH